MRSIMTDNLKVCYYCGTTEGVELHHCIHGNKENRALSTQFHLLIGCCSNCHRGINGIHGKYGKEKDLKLQAEAQQAWEKRRVRKGKSKPDTVRQEWLDIFGIDYIKIFQDYINECEEDFVNNDDIKCENCKYFAKLYVPELKMYENIPKDAYVCRFQDDKVMYLGTEEQGGKNSLCEYYNVDK